MSYVIVALVFWILGAWTEHGVQTGRWWRL